MFKKKENIMLPDASPDTMTAATGVRRANNLPLYLIGFALIAVALVHSCNINSKADNKNTEETLSTTPTSSSQKHAQYIVGEREYGEIPPAEKAEQNVPQKQFASSENSPVPVKINNVSPTKPLSNEEIERIRSIKMQQLDAAVKAKTNVPLDMPRTTTALAVNQPNPALSASNRSNDPTAAYQAGLADIQNNNSSGVNTTPQLVKTSSSIQNDRWRLDSSPEAPRTPYELRAGFVLPATLISGINSELPGQIMGQVSQNVYDTPTGKHLLIPQGSRLVGTYSSDVAYGQSRVLVAWQRIVFPDGKAMDIGEMPGADVAGYSGFNDKVNNHYVRIFGSAILMSAITAGYAYSQDNNDEDWFATETASSELSAALGQQLGDVSAQMIAKNLNIAPTLEIRPGFQFNVMVTKDLTFDTPYQSFDY